MNKKLLELKSSILKTKHLIVPWFIVLTIVSDVLIISVVYSGYWYLLLAYIVFIYLDPKSKLGNESPNKHRNNPIFSLTRDYFDMKIIKTTDIPATKNYIFGYHPHGIAPFGLCSGLNSNSCGFDDLFPGIKLNLKGHEYTLRYPFLREFCLYFGSQSVSRESILNTLSKEGNSVAINIGGGAEMIYAVPGTAKLIIKNRFGFVRIALETGSDLVPIYGFGETDTYDQSPVDQNSYSFRIRRWLYKKANFFLPMISGRGILPNTKGIFPHNVPIRVVVGKPIKVEKTANPTDEQIRELHERYCNELKALYNEYKDKFWYDPNTSPPELELLENPLK